MTQRGNRIPQQFHSGHSPIIRPHDTHLFPPLQPTNGRRVKKPDRTSVHPIICMRPSLADLTKMLGETPKRRHKVTRRLHAS